jgi:hypothetical protein
MIEMRDSKYYIILLVGFFLLFLPIASKLIQFEDTNSTIENLSTAAVPVITEIGGGFYDLDTYWENYTGNGPWLFDHESWVLYWYVNYTADASIWYFYYNTTYGSLNGYNGSFTPLNPTQGPGISYDNKMNCFEFANPDELVNFGWEVTVWIEDSDGFVSTPVTELFKYYNGTIEEPIEELVFIVNTITPVVNLNEPMVFDFDISDPDGPRSYQINYTCDYENFNSISSADVTGAAALFTPKPAGWDPRVNYTITFNFTVWESSVMVDSIVDTGTTYSNTPPENGTYSITLHEKTDSDVYIYNISCSAWEDDLDGNGSFFYKCISTYEIDNPGHFDVMHEGSNETDFQIGVTERYNGYCYLRIYDSHGAYTECNIGWLGTPYQNYPDLIAGYPIYLLISSIVSIAAILFWKFKKQSISN